jgi:hypothetical protein
MDNSLFYFKNVLKEIKERNLPLIYNQGIRISISQKRLPTHEAIRDLLSGINILGSTLKYYQNKKTATSDALNQLINNIKDETTNLNSVKSIVYKSLPEDLQGINSPFVIGLALKNNTLDDIIEQSVAYLEDESEIDVSKEEIEVIESDIAKLEKIPKAKQNKIPLEQGGGVFFTPDVSCEKIGGQAQIKGGSECPNRGPADPSFYKELYGGGVGAAWWNTKSKRKTPKRRTAAKRTQKKKAHSKRRV